MDEILSCYVSNESLLAVLSRVLSLLIEYVNEILKWEHSNEKN